jgi:hypothetical protein
MKSRTVFFPPLCLALLLLSGARAYAKTAPKLSVVGTGFQVTTPDGKVLSGPDLAGASLVATVDGQVLRVKIKSVVRDTVNPNVWLNSFVYTDAQGVERSFCRPSADGVAAGFPITGRMNDDGTISASPDGHFELTCTSGAQGKCVRFGYEPDKRSPDGKGTLRDYYNACIRLVRADYGGAGAGTTKDGTLIDIYDRIGVQKDEPVDGSSFEAGFDAKGAVCVARPRIAENVTLEKLGETYPRLAGHLGPEKCDEATAAALGALVFVKSR